MKPTVKKSTILLAGDDPAFVDLAQRLKAQGFNAEHATDGNLALQLALDLKPSLVVIDAALRAIPAPRFAQILRTNRQGNDLPIVFVGADGEEIEGFVRHRDGFFARPLNGSQLVAFVEKHFNRVARAQQLLQQKQEVEGSLDQLGITDLLQLFGLNGKSGTLFLARGAERGTVLLRNGQIINAHLGRVDGEKALFRLLLWTSGTFRFSPGAVSGSAKISASIEHLIMEGLRLGDEAAAQAERLPARQSRMQLTIPKERLPQGLRSATREILLKLESYPRVSDLLDHCPYADLQILQVLRVLREKGVISESRDESVGVIAPLLTATAIHAVHQRLYGVDRLGEDLTAIVLILSPSALAMSEFMPTLHVLPEFVSSSPPLDDPLLPVELGRLPLSENFALRFITVPALAEFSPLWALYTRQLFGVITLAPIGSFPVAERIFSSCGTVLVSLDAQERRALSGRGVWHDHLIRYLPRFQSKATMPEVL